MDSNYSQDSSNDEYLEDFSGDIAERQQSEVAEKEERQARRQEMYRQQLEAKKQGVAINKRLQNLQKTQKMKNSAAFGDEIDGGGKVKKTKATIGTGGTVMLFTVAGFFDLIGFLLNLIPVVGGVAAFIVATAPGKLILKHMHKKNGIDTKNPKVLKIFWGSFAVEAIPVVNALPALILGELLTIMAHESSTS